MKTLASVFRYLYTFLIIILKFSGFMILGVWAIISGFKMALLNQSLFDVFWESFNLALWVGPLVVLIVLIHAIWTTRKRSKRQV